MKTRNLAHESMEFIQKYRSDTPIYCKTPYYIALVIAATILDGITTFSRLEPILGSLAMAIICSFAIVVVFDVYSIVLPRMLRYMPSKPKTVFFGALLGLLIIVVAVLNLRFRVESTSVDASNTDIILSADARRLLEILLSMIPFVSTIAILNLSIIKMEWDDINDRYRDDQILIILHTQEKELSESIKVIDLQLLDDTGYTNMRELIIAKALWLKNYARQEFALALEDSESAVKLTQPVIPDYILTKMAPGPLDDSIITHPTITPYAS